MTRQKKEVQGGTDSLYRTLFEFSADGILIADIETRRFKYANPAACRMLGYTEKELQEMNVTEIHPKEDLPRVMAEFEAQARKDKTLALDIPCLRKDGSIVYADANTVSVTIDGRLCNLGMFRDITDRKRIEAALHENEMRLQEAQLLAHIGNWELDLSTNLLTWSDEIFRIFEIDKAAFGASYEAFLAAIHPEDRDAVHTAYSRSLEDRKPYSIVHRLRMPDGRIKYVQEQCETDYSPEGKPLRSVGTVQDITDLKRAEEVLRESEERLRSLINSTPDIICFKDGEGRWLEANAADLELFSLTNVDYRGKTDLQLAEFTNPMYRNAFQTCAASDEKAWEAKGLSRGDEVITKPDGTVKTYDVIKVPIFEGTDGKRKGLVVLGRDITGRKRAEEEKAVLEGRLQQAQKMEAVGRLAGGVAHDFNNILGIILGFTDMTLDLMDPAQPLAAYLKEVRKAAESAAAITRQLLAFARKQPATPKVLNLNETVEGLLRMLQRLIGEDIALDWRPTKANLWPVKMDPSQIDQILANLCVNARDAIADTGRVTIETENVSLDESYCAGHADSVPGDYVRLSVSDNGCGIDKETMARIFEPFFTTKATGKGTGLGLATVYGIVKQNGGNINIYSEPGQGTTFTIYLPRHAGRDESVQDVHPAEIPRGDETILVVEDNLAMLQMTRTMLELQGYTVLVANTPDEAISLAGHHAGGISLIITDVVMPGMNGRDLVLKLKSLCPHLKHLYMSGYTAGVIAQHGVSDEEARFIQKPFTKQTLSAKVREVLDSGQS
ncbi:MAG: PAS domain S-box protein [Kiritimatiellia bacterium]